MRKRVGGEGHPAHHREAATRPAAAAIATESSSPSMSIVLMAIVQMKGCRCVVQLVKAFLRQDLVRRPDPRSIVTQAQYGAG